MVKFEGVPAGGIVVEYAKVVAIDVTSNRSTCKKCQKFIGDGQMRLGTMVQSRFFDGVTPTWNHVDCNFKGSAARALSGVEQIFGFEELRWEDQQKLRDKFQKAVLDKAVIDDGTTEAGRRLGLRVEYAKSGKSRCRGCETFIDKEDVRLAFLIEGIYGPIPAWHHRDCFFKTHPDMVKQLEDLAGWKNIEEEDREDLKQRIASAHDGPHAGESSSSKSKTTSADVKPVKDLDHDKKIAEESVPVVDKATSERQRQQSQRQWEIKDWLTDELDQFTLKEGKAALHQILDANGYHLGERSEHTLKDVLVDALTFGVPELCASCKQSRLVWDTPGGKYVCPVAEAWGQCTQTAQADEVEHTPAAIPKDFPLRGIAKFGKKPLLKRVTTKRVEKYTLPTRAELPKVWSPKRKQLEESNAAEEEQTSKRVKLTLKGRAAVDPETGLDDTHHIVDHDGKTYNALLASTDVGTGRNSYYKLQLLEADWVSEKPTTTHSGRPTRKPRSGAGSASYYLFRSWGRVGTDIGDCRVERCADKVTGARAFEEKFLEKTGNEFRAERFDKKPRMFYPLELSTPSEGLLAEADEGRVKPGSKTKLPAPVQELIRMIFDVEAMKRAMLEMEIDLSKMPLGQISRGQITNAYAILTQISDLLTHAQADNTTVHKGALTPLTNQFYTLIPHDFGYKTPPLLDSVDMVKEKLEMLETLLEIEVATSIVKEERDARADEDPYDLHYEALHADIGPLDKKSEQYSLIEKYVETTHAATHAEYTIHVEDVYEVSREGEEQRYAEKLQQIPDLAANRKLLWHGSRLTNYVGIISQGLKIAPKEAPSTGYMFGKGIYFSDTCSKSANYCRPHRNDQTEGLLVLSEVALGVPYEKTESEFIKQLPSGKHSTMGCGQNVPTNSATLEVPWKKKELAPKGNQMYVTSSPSRAKRSTRSRAKLQTQASSTSSTAVQLPLGPIVADPKRKKSDLLYNEYIVYDEAQSVMRYLVRVRFEFATGRGRKRGS